MFMKKYKCFLFDMDGTVVNSNINAFLENYVKELFEIYKSTKPNEVKNFDEFKNAFEKSWFETKIKDEKDFNNEYFCKVLASELKADVTSVNQIFLLWNNDYSKKFGCYGFAMPYMEKAVKFLKEKGVKIGLATNPYFSREMINNRLSWGHLSISDFDFVSSWDIVHYAKPNLKFYDECCSLIGEEKENILFVGNDTVQDASCEKTGIDCFLIKDFLSERNGIKASSKFVGSSKEFFEFLQEMFK
jgi:FMN phosphatase YigB (HAD superfamily)